ncbi:MAG: cobalt ECF transporter T component CbiQ, partial [Lachnospiraceae bacterium]
LACVVSRSVAIGILVLITTGILTVHFGGIPLSRYLHLMRIPLIFLILSTIAILVNFSSVPLDAFAVKAGSIYITTSYEALRHTLQLIVTALAGVSCLYFLSLSTPMTDILLTLKFLRCPSILIELMLLIYRFIFILLSIAEAIYISQISRLGNRNFKTFATSSANLMSVLFIRAFARSSALYDAMESRCYDGSIRVLSEHYPRKRNEMIYIAAFELILILLIILLKVFRKGMLI